MVVEFAVEVDVLTLILFAISICAIFVAAWFHGRASAYQTAAEKLTAIVHSLERRSTPPPPPPDD